MLLYNYSRNKEWYKDFTQVTKILKSILIIHRSAIMGCWSGLQSNGIYRCEWDVQFFRGVALYTLGGSPQECTQLSFPFIPRRNINPHWTLLLIETENLSKHTSCEVGLPYREAHILKLWLTSGKWISTAILPTYKSIYVDGFTCCCLFWDITSSSHYLDNSINTYTLI